MPMTILGEPDFIARFDAGETTIHARLFEKERKQVSSKAAALSREIKCRHGNDRTVGTVSRSNAY